jgi:hypothetical protein
MKMNMKTAIKNKKESYWKCKKCGDEIYWNIHKKMIHYKCGVLGVDGCEYYVLLIGDKNDRKEVMRYRKL